MNRLERFELTLQNVIALQVKYEWSVALKSIAEQLEYLIALERGDCCDRSKLANINIGILAAREVEDMDLSLASELHSISTEVKHIGSNASGV